MPVPADAVAKLRLQVQLVSLSKFYRISSPHIKFSLRIWFSLKVVTVSVLFNILETLPHHFGTLPDHLRTLPDHFGTLPDHLRTQPGQLGTPPYPLVTLSELTVLISCVAGHASIRTLGWWSGLGDTRLCRTRWSRTTWSRTRWSRTRWRRTGWSRTRWPGCPSSN